EAERALCRGQRDVHDRRVEDDHQLGDAEHRQDQPAALVVDGGGLGWGHWKLPGARYVEGVSQLLETKVAHNWSISLHLECRPPLRYNQCMSTATERPL